MNNSTGESVPLLQMNEESFLTDENINDIHHDYDNDAFPNQLLLNRKQKMNLEETLTRANHHVLDDSQPDWIPSSLFGKEVPNPSFRQKLMRILPLGTVALYKIFEIVLQVSYGADSCPMPFILGAIAFGTVYAFSVPWLHYFESHTRHYHVVFHAVSSGISFLAITVLNKDVTYCLWHWVDPVVNSSVVLMIWFLVSLGTFILHIIDSRNTQDNLIEEYQRLREDFFRNPQPTEKSSVKPLDLE